MTNKVLKTISLKWTWQGDTFMLKGFNIALMKNDATPANGLDNMISYTTLDKNCYNPNTNKFEYSFYNLAMDAGVKCTPWIQALFENDDSEWVSLNGTVIEDDGNATIVVIGNPTFQQVIDMSKDNKITPQEKEQLKKEWDEITSDHFSIYAGITKANLSNEDQDVKAYISAANELAKYFNNNKIYYWHQSNDPQYVYPEMIVDGLTTDLNTGHYISVATYREKIRLYYETKVKILNLIQDTILANNNQLIQDEIDKNTLPSTIAIGGYTSCDFTKNSPATGCIKIGMGSFSTTTGHKFNIKSDHNITTSLTSNKFKTRFILFVGADFSRFNVTTSANNNSNMFVTAIHKKGKWYYFDGANETLKEFTPMAEDCVVAKIEEYNTTQTANNGIESIKFYASTSQSIFDSLTDGGKLQGVFKDEGGRLFINAEFIQANSITADKMNIKGIKVINVDTGETTFEVTSKGLVNISANRFVLTAGSDTNVPTKDEVKNDIDNIQIGVRNIIKDGGISVTNTNYLIQTYNTHVPLATGKTYTIVFKGSIAEGQQFGLWYNGGNASVGRWDRKPGSAVYIKTFTITEVLKTDYLSIYNYPSATGKTATIEWACLYEGNVKPPLDFVQAPEDMQVGGRNLVLNSAPKTNTGWSWAGTAGTATLVDEATAPRGKAMKATFTADGSSGGMHKPPKERLKSGSIYSWACWIKASKEMTINLGHEQDGSKEFVINTEWQRITHTFKASDRSYNSFVMYARNPKIGDFYLVHSIQVEAGNIIGDWSAAPEDYDAEIADANQKAQEALNNLTDLANDNKLTPNEKQQTKKEWDVILGEYPKVISEANKSSVSTTNYTNAYNTLKSYIEPILSNLTTTSDITGVAFRNNFKSYYDNKQDVLNAISTALKANADNANNKIDGLEIGTNNIIRNSRNPKSLDFWPYCPSPSNVELVDSNYFGTPEKFFSIVNTTTTERYLGTQRYKLEGGKTYSFGMIVNLESNVTSMDVWLLMKIAGSTAADYDVAKQVVVGYNKVRNKFHRITGTLTIPDNIVEGYIRVDNNGGAATANRLWFSAVKLEQATKPSDWSAAPEDTQSDIDNKVDVGGSIDDINQSPNGQIDYPKLNIRGAISFDDLDSEMGKNFIAKKDSQGNRIQTVINGGAIETSSVTADKMSMYNLNVIRRELVNGVWQERDTSFAITDEGKIRASGTFSSFNYKDDIDISKSEGWMINENGDSVFNNSVVRGRVELPNAGVTNSCSPDNHKIDLLKYCRNLLNTPLIVTNPADPIYASSGCPNPPVGMTINSYDQSANTLKKGEASSNGNCWAIIAAEKAYHNISDTTAKNKLKDIIVKSANFMVNNLSVGRFNSMDFKFVDVSYKYNETTKVWERGNYKEIYVSSMWLQVRSLLLAFEMTGTTSYKDTALLILDSLYNMHIYINQKVIEGELPTKLNGASYTFLACDNLSSSNRFSASRHFGHQIGYYLCQAIEEVIRLVGDSERTTPKGDKYKPSSIVDNYKEYLRKAYNDGLTTSPTGLPYGCYYRTGTSPNYEYVQGNWDFINGTWGDSWFVGDVVCYTIYSYAKIGLKDIAKKYLDAYYNVRVNTSSDEWGTRFSGDLVFYDRIDFQGNHLSNDKSVSITYTALFYEIARELGVEKYFNICAKTLYKWQVKSSNKFIDGGYPWDVSKDGQTLELKSYGEIINSECHKRFNLVNNEYITNDNPVRIWSGTTYENRENAPCKILQDGSIIATKGEFNGTVTGRLEIGNISIYDDLTTPGVIEIKNNDNSKSVVRIGEEYSEFNSDVYIGSKSNYLFRTNIANKQLVSGKQSSIKFEYEDTINGDKLSSSLTISGRKIQFNQNEYIYSTNSGVIELGTDSTKGILNIRSSHNSDSDGILGEMQVNIVGSASISNVLKLGNVDLMPVYPSGLDIFVN